jgi:hypothetical protein
LWFSANRDGIIGCRLDFRERTQWNEPQTDVLAKFEFSYTSLVAVYYLRRRVSFFLEHPATAEIVKTTEGIFIPRELTSTPRSMCRGVVRTPIGAERRVAHWMRSWSVSMVRESAVTLSMQAELSNGYSGARQRQGEESAEL